MLHVGHWAGLQGTMRSLSDEHLNARGYIQHGNSIHVHVHDMLTWQHIQQFACTCTYMTILRFTTQLNTTQNSTTQLNTTQLNTIQHSTTQFNTTKHNIAQHSTVQHSTTQFNTAELQLRQSFSEANVLVWVGLKTTCIHVHVH